jgi:hypothetical protein
MSDENKTVETFSEKIMRMFLPIRPRKSTKSIKDADIETVDPLERFEKAIVRDSEAKGKTKLEEPKSKEQKN